MALPADELELISKKLTFDPDYIRFRSVCKSWRSAAPKRPQLPWLISYYTKISDKTSIFANFYQFSFQTNRIKRVPELLDSPLLSSFIDNSTVCIGSSHGWLAFINKEILSVLLFNPLTNSSIDLPNLCVNACFSSDRIFYLTSDPNESLSDCIAVISRNGFELLYCKIGSNAWTQLTFDPIISISNFCSYHGKHFIASEGDVFMCDFGPNLSVCKIISVSLDDDDDDDDIYHSEINFRHSWLVESDEDLLFVLLYYNVDLDTFYYRIFKLEVECHVPKSVELEDLGNRALFLSEKNAFSLTASKYPGCKESGIYRAFIYFKEGHPIQMLEVCKYGEFLKNWRIKNRLAPLEALQYNCDWFYPSLLM